MTPGRLRRCRCTHGSQRQWARADRSDHELLANQGIEVADRGLRDVALGSEDGQPALEELRARIVPVVSKVLARAQTERVVRSDITVGDLVLILFMVTELARHSADVDTLAYRQYLEVFLNGLHPVASSTPLTPTLSEIEVGAIAQRWVLSGQGRSTGNPDAQVHPLQEQ